MLSEQAKNVGVLFGQWGFASEVFSEPCGRSPVWGGSNELKSQPADCDHWLPPGMQRKEDEFKQSSELEDSAE